MTARRKTAAALKSRGGRDGHKAKLPATRKRAGRPDGAADSARSVCYPHEVVSGRGVPASSDPVRLHAAGCSAGERADALREAAGDVKVVAERLIVRSITSVWDCKRRLPLNETIDLSIDERIRAGDLEAIHDMTREAISDLETLADRIAGLLCDEPEALRRLSEVRLRQSRTGKNWHGGAIANKDASVTDHAGTEPRGPGHEQDRPRGARAGKAATKRSARC